VAIPFFSNLDYLGIALRSLVAQTDSIWSAIVVDDVGPELGAEQLVASLADSRIRYVRNERNL
ncbi:MAG TPA: glycosyltransferase, partial [Ilumatobacteraceae bacterium]|nr:glycosyltransferase [Ilumatobacteraceae bacterium]